MPCYRNVMAIMLVLAIMLLCYVIFVQRPQGQDQPHLTTESFPSILAPAPSILQPFDTDETRGM